MHDVSAHHTAPFADKIAEWVQRRLHGKGGRLEDTIDRACLCNGLMATAGRGQIQARGYREPPIVTSGDCINEVVKLLHDRTTYYAADVIAHREGAPDTTLFE